MLLMLLRWTHKKAKFIQWSFLWFKFISSTIIVIFMIKNHQIELFLYSKNTEKNTSRIEAQSSNYHWKLWKNLVKPTSPHNTLHKIIFKHVNPGNFLWKFHTIPYRMRTKSRISMSYRHWTITMGQNHCQFFNVREEKTRSLILEKMSSFINFIIQAN